MSYKNKKFNIFNDLKFTDYNHSYSVGNKQLPSVSKKITAFYTPFNTKKIAKETALRRNVTPESLIAEWDATRIEACDRGTRVHNFGEEYVWDRHLKPSCKQEEAVVAFWKSLPEHIHPVTMELKMYHKKYDFAGTGDILLYNTKTNNYIIADYKTNKDLFKNFAGKKLKAPFENLLENPFNKYQIQLSYYQLLFEQTGYKIERRIIVWLSLDGTFKMYDTEDYTEKLEKLLQKDKILC